MNRVWLLFAAVLAVFVLLSLFAFKLLGLALLVIARYWYIALGLILILWLIRTFRRKGPDRGVYRDSRGAYIETEYKVEEDDAVKRK